MPNIQRITTPFLQAGSPSATKVVINTVADYYAPGQLGCSFDYQNSTYTFVLVEPAVTTLLVGQVLYWKDTTNFIVTNILANAIGGATSALSQVAGVSVVAFASTGTLGTMICMVTGQSKNVTAQIDATTVAAGSILAASTTAACFTLGTTGGVTALVPIFAVARGAKSGSPAVALVDLNIPTLA